MVATHTERTAGPVLGPAVAEVLRTALELDGQLAADVGGAGRALQGEAAGSAGGAQVAGSNPIVREDDTVHVGRMQLPVMAGPWRYPSVAQTPRTFAARTHSLTFSRYHSYSHH